MKTSCVEKSEPGAGPELTEELYGLQDMIEYVFRDDRTQERKKKILSAGLWESISDDIRIRVFQRDFVSNFNLKKSLQLDLLSRLYPLHQQKSTEFVVDTTNATMKIAKRTSECTKDVIQEIRTIDHLYNFASAYQDLALNMKKHNQIPSELYYQRCFESFLQSLCLTTIPGTPRRQRYFVPLLDWSETGSTVVQPHGIVVTKTCRQIRHHNAFAYLGVSKKSTNKTTRGHSLPRRQGKPKIPKQCVQECLDKMLPQHFLELLLSADDTIFTTYKLINDTTVPYYTKVGLIQQGMHVNVVMLKLTEEKYGSFVVTKEEAAEQKRCVEARKRKASDSGSLESPESDRAESRTKISKLDSDEELPSGPTMDAISADDLVKDKTLDHPVKRVGFKINVEENGAKWTSQNLEAPELYISKPYLLLSHEDRLELVQALIMLEKISDGILGEQYGI